MIQQKKQEKEAAALATELLVNSASVNKPKTLVTEEDPVPDGITIDLDLAAALLGVTRKPPQGGAQGAVANATPAAAVIMSV